MTRKLGRGDAQRGRARLALVFVSLVSAVLILGLTPAGSLIPLFAAPTGSPTATTTKTTAPPAGSTPTAGTAPTIQLVNPSKYEADEIISDKQDANSTYHLVATVGNTPPSPDVRFEFYNSSNVLVKQVIPVQIGSTDVWEAQWPVDIPDGDYTLTARLLSAAATPGTVATDNESVTVDNDTDGGNDREAAEITYPVDAGPLGTYDPPGGGVDRGFTMEVRTSAGVSDVDAFYSTAPPGTEPNWRHCSRQVTISYSSNDRVIGCTAASNVTAATDITAVAVVTQHDVEFDPLNPCSDFDVGPPPTCPPSIDSGDAHRVAGYDQIPTSVTVDPSGSTAPVNTCRELTATVLDQSDVPRPIFRANVDVHATGPLDNTTFGKSTHTSAYKAPDGGGHDVDEASSNCGAAPSNTEKESVHIHATTADTKHIESVNGSDPNGQFIFDVKSPDQGTTSVSAWADVVDDDFAANDPTGVAAVTWGASPTGSATSSATSTATSTSTATATTTTTASASHSPTTTTSSGPATRTITLETDKSRVSFGKQVTLSGAISSSNQACESDQPVRIQRALAGGDFTDFGTATSSSSGEYSFHFQADEDASYRAMLDANSGCSGATSSTRNVLVRVKVHLRVDHHNVKRGRKLTFEVTVEPCGNHAGSSVVLLRNTGHGYKEIGHADLGNDCHATFHRKARADANYKARWPSQDDNHETGTSSHVKVNVKNDRDG